MFPGAGRVMVTRRVVRCAVVIAGIAGFAIGMVRGLVSLAHDIHELWSDRPEPIEMWPWGPSDI